MASSNHIVKIAIVGGSGNVGTFITKALLETEQHAVTAITRSGSESSFPQGVLIKTIDYDEPKSLIEALRGHDALVIALGGRVPNKLNSQLIEAAGEAGVSLILPSEWGNDSANEDLVNDLPGFDRYPANRKTVEVTGKSSYIAISTGFWYEWSLAMPDAFGFDIAQRKVTFFDDGKTKISSSTWPQVGRAVAAVLSLPIRPENGSACLEQVRNKVVYVQSFTISQMDIFESALRVTGTSKSDWAVSYEPSRERNARGLRELQSGDGMGYVRMLYSRGFFQDGCGNLESHPDMINKLLDLQVDDMDVATRRAMERASSV